MTRILSLRRSAVPTLCHGAPKIGHARVAMLHCRHAVRRGLVGTQRALIGPGTPVCAIQVAHDAALAVRVAVLLIVPQVGVVGLGARCAARLDGVEHLLAEGVLGEGAALHALLSEHKVSVVRDARQVGRIPPKGELQQAMAARVQVRHHHARAAEDGLAVRRGAPRREQQVAHLPVRRNHAVERGPHVEGAHEGAVMLHHEDVLSADEPRLDSRLDGPAKTMVARQCENLGVRPCAASSNRT